MEPFDDVVGRLFPPFVRGVLTPTGADCYSPYAEERAAVAGAVPRRQREFFCGRASAHAALSALGRDDGPIPVGAGRQPLWPDGVVGSISHAGEWSGAVVAGADDAWSLGFDIEVLDPPLSPGVERLVLTQAEREAGADDGGRSPGRYRSKIAFSVKESVYKCIFAGTGRRLTFAEVDVDVDLGAGRWIAGIRDAEPLRGRLVVVHGYLLTGVCVPTTTHAVTE